MATITEVDRRVSGSLNEMTVTRTLDVYPYASYPAVMNLLLGGFGVANGLAIFRAPLRDTYHPWCFCTSVDVEGVGAFGSTVPSGNSILAARNGYSSHARLTVTYKATVPESEMDDADNNQEAPAEIDRAEQGYEFSVQNLTLPTKYYKFKYGGGPHPSLVKGINATKTIPRIEYTLMRHFVVNLPIVSITRLLGRINASDFRVGKVTWAAECLRFDGASVKQKITNRGYKLFDVTYKFAVNPIYDKYATSAETVPNKYIPDSVTVPATTATGYVGWNRVFRPERNYWDKLVLNVDPAESTYKLDSGVTLAAGSKNVTGFNLLFHPRAK